MLGVEGRDDVNSASASERAVSAFGNLANIRDQHQHIATMRIVGTRQDGRPQFHPYA